MKFTTQEFEVARKWADKLVLEHGLDKAKEFTLFKARVESGRRKVLFNHAARYIQRAV